MRIAIPIGLTFLLLAAEASAQSEPIVPWHDEHVVAMYVSGEVSEYARDAGIEYWTYVGRVMDDLVEMGITTVHPNNLLSEDLPRWLELARDRGLRLVYQGGVPMRDYYIYSLTDPTWGTVVTRQYRRSVFEDQMLRYYRDVFVPRHRTDPTLLAYCAVEEIQDDDVMIWEDLRNLTAACERVDTAHPVFIEHIWMDRLVSSLRTYQPRITSYGPGTLGDEAWSADLQYFEVWLQESYAACRDSLARTGRETVFWAVLESTQEYRWVEQQERWVFGPQTPSAADYGLQAWLAYANGANGVDFWWYHTIPEGNPVEGFTLFEGVRDEQDRRTPRFAAIQSVCAQLAPLAPWLPYLRADLENGGLPYQREGNPVRMRLLRHPGTHERFVLVVNKDTRYSQVVGHTLSPVLPAGRLPKRLPERQEVDPATLRIPPGQGVLLWIPEEE